MLLINGSGDVTVSPAGRADVLSQGKAEERVITGVGHYALMERPEDFAREVGDFLRRTFE